MIETYQKDLLKNIFSWLEILEEISKNTTDTSGLPKLEVSLNSGRTFAGSVIGLKTSIEGNILMLLEQADLYYNSRIHLIQCEEIAALSFVDPATYLSIFTKPIVSELELKRKAKIIEDHIKELTSTNIPISLLHESITESDRSQVLQLIQEFPSIFKKLITDNTSKKMVSESIIHINIQMDKTTGSQLNDKTLICTFEKNSEEFLSKQKEKLFHSIEKAL